MKIWLDQVREEPFSWDETEAWTAETLACPEVVELGPVRWQGDVTFADPGYLLRGRLSYDQTLACTRCLRPLRLSAEAEVELLILVDGQAGRHGTHRSARAHRAAEEETEERELAELDLNTVMVTEEVLDTGAIVLEQLQLNVPMKPLCRVDCPGLCPRCGADLDAGRCSCDTAPADPRWHALEGIRNQLEAPDRSGSS